MTTIIKLITVLTLELICAITQAQETPETSRNNLTTQNIEIRNTYNQCANQNKVQILSQNKEL